MATVLAPEPPYRRRLAPGRTTLPKATGNRHTVRPHGQGRPPGPPAHLASLASLARFARFAHATRRAVPAVPWAAVRAVAAVLMAVAQLAVGSAVAYDQAFADRFYPGIAVRVAGAEVSLGTRTPEQARERIGAALQDLSERPVLLRTPDGEFRATLGELGLAPDEGSVGRVLADAWQTGHEARPLPWLRQQWSLWHGGARFALGLTMDRERARQTLLRLAQEADRAPLDARLQIEPAASGVAVQVAPARAGWRVDVAATLDRLQQALAAGDPASVDLAVQDVPPLVGDAQLAAAYDQVTRVLSAPAVLSWDGPDGPHTWPISPEGLAAAVRVTGPGDGAGDPPAASLDEAQVRDWVDQVAQKVDQPAVNASLEVRGTAVALVPGKAGRLLDREAAAAALAARLASGDHSVRLPVKEDRPWIDEATLAKLRDRLNARLAAPPVLQEGERQWSPESHELAALLVIPDTQALARPGPGDAGGAPPPIEASLDPVRLRALLLAHLPALLGHDPSEIAQDPILEISGGRVEVRPARGGIGADLDALAEQVAAAFQSDAPAAPVIQVRAAPRAAKRPAPGLVAARDAASRLVSRPVTVHCAFDEWVITPDQLAAMLRFQQQGAELAPYLGRDQLVQRVAAIAKTAEARAAVLNVKDPSGQPARVDVLGTAAEVWAHAQSGDDRVAELRWQEPNT